MANYVVNNGYYIGGDDEQSKKIVNEELSKFDMNSLLEGIVVTKKVSGDAWWQVSWGSKEIDNITELDPRFVVIVPETTKINGQDMPVAGKIKEYKMVYNEQDIVTYSPDEIIHFKNNAFCNEPYGISDIGVINDDVVISWAIKQDMADAIDRNAHPVFVWSVGNPQYDALGSPTDMAAFQNNIEDRDPGEDVFHNGLVSGNVLQANPASLNVDFFIKYYEEQLRLDFPAALTGADGNQKGAGNIPLQLLEMNIKSEQSQISKQIETLVSSLLQRNGVKIFKKSFNRRPRLLWNEVNPEDQKEQAIKFRLLRDGGMSKPIAMNIVGLDKWTSDESKEEEKLKKELQSDPKAPARGNRNPLDPTKKPDEEVNDDGEK